MFLYEFALTQMINFLKVIFELHLELDNGKNSQNLLSFCYSMKIYEKIS